MKKNTCKSCKYAQPPKPGFPDKVYCGHYLLHMSSFSETECCYFDREIKTNYDLIVSMMPEELAAYIDNHCCEAMWCISPPEDCPPDEDCRGCILKWLNSEAPS